MPFLKIDNSPGGFMPENLVVVSKVKKIVKDAGFRTGGDYIEALSTKINAMLGASIERVKADGKKKTLGAEDLQ
jgi:hypothetical protein